MSAEDNINTQITNLESLIIKYNDIKNILSGYQKYLDEKVKLDGTAK